jgi:hypothetical protein
MMDHLKGKHVRGTAVYLPVVLMLLLFALSGCDKNDERIPASTFVGRWYMSSYMEDVNGNQTNDDPKVLLQSYEYYTLNFTNDNRVKVYAQREPTNVFDLTYDWSVSTSGNVVLHLTTPGSVGSDRYDIRVAAVSGNTLVLIHDNYATVQALRFLPPHAYSTNWLIFTRQ